MSDKQDVREEEVVAIPTADEMRRAAYNKESLCFTFDELGRVSVRVIALEEAEVSSARMFIVTGVIEKPIPRLFGLLSPKEVRILSTIITCFPDNPGEKDIGVYTVLRTQKI
ncbi:MAG: hypothetical protein WAU28_04090 [Candidatus Moraniibacteriota bacterium]